MSKIPNTTLWDSVECDSWSRNFDHEAYLHSLKLRGYVHSALNEPEYAQLCRILDQHLERQNGAN